MSNTVIRLASNPYDKTVKYFLRKDNDWERIDSTNSPNSKLLNKELVEGFFPFKAKEIVDVILSEYQAGAEPVTIEFEGSDDEYEELSSICSSDNYPNYVTLSRGEKSLANARDILPDIINVFNSIKPLVNESIIEKGVIEQELNKFCDVSSDLIPLCVLGNYSAGKSTFINALIGHELLPNGDMPVTAKVFQIKRSKQKDRASISFELGGSNVTMRFDANGIVNAKELAESALCARLKESLSRTDGMIKQMNAALELINSYKPKTDDSSIDDLIDIEVPFCTSDPWWASHEFVIFDTPGSNSASNEDHIRVLRKAMEGLSNGLPIYIAEYNSLDSTDNEKLYGEIKRIEAMDDRFAMIVVNKADSAELPKGSFSESDIEQIMEMATPRNLYAQGIYFVSSILGLGSKTRGEFMSDNYAEKYEDQERKYSNPDNRFYKTLYRYNILPGQISQRTTAESEKCSNLVFANSGLYCIEQEIALFAERYSAYNKCHQSEALLGQIIDITASQIKNKEETCRQHKADLEQELEDDKAKLLNDLDACGECIQTESIEGYPKKVARTITADPWRKTLGELQERESVLFKKSMTEYGFDDDSKEAEIAKKVVGANLGKRVGDAFAAPSIDSLGDVISGLISDVNDHKDKAQKARETQRKAEIEMSEKLLEEVKAEFNERLGQINDVIDRHSRDYWEAESESARMAIKQLATNNTVLSDEKRREIEAIIIQYPPLALKPDTDAIFERQNFDSLRLFNILFFQSTRLNLGKVAKTYNEEIEVALNGIKSEIRVSHEISYRKWLTSLLGKVKENITEYNPTLSRHVKLIIEDERNILELTKKLDTLQRCTENIAKMIDWR